MQISESKSRKVRAGLEPNRESRVGYAEFAPKRIRGAASNVFCESFAFQHQALTRFRIAAC
jgi:hypothetical protein